MDWKTGHCRDTVHISGWNRTTIHRGQPGRILNPAESACIKHCLLQQQPSQELGTSCDRERDWEKATNIPQIRYRERSSMQIFGRCPSWLPGCSFWLWLLVVAAPADADAAAVVVAETNGAQCVHTHTHTTGTYSHTHAPPRVESKESWP